MLFRSLSEARLVEGLPRAPPRAIHSYSRVGEALHSVVGERHERSSTEFFIWAGAANLQEGTKGSVSFVMRWLILHSCMRGIITSHKTSLLLSLDGYLAWHEPRRALQCRVLMCRGVKHNAAGWASAHFRAVGSIGNLVSNSLLALHFSRSRHVSCTRDVHFPMPSHCCPLHLGRIQVAA